MKCVSFLDSPSKVYVDATPISASFYGCYLSTPVAMYSNAGRLMVIEGLSANPDKHPSFH